MVCAPDPATRESLAADTITARQKLVAHLAHEESGALALAQRVLSPARWDAVMAEFNEGLGLRELSFLVPWALHRLPAPAVDRLRAGKQRALLRLNVLFRRRFERYERAAFRQA
jgi:hypothetical protein